MSETSIKWFGMYLCCWMKDLINFEATQINLDLSEGLKID